MKKLDIPLGKRTAAYRFFEMVPALLSYGALILLVFLSFVSPLLAAIYILLIIITFMVRAVGITAHTLIGSRRLRLAQTIHWHERLADFNDPVSSYELRKQSANDSFGAVAHIENLRLAAAAPELFPKPSDIYNVVIIAAYNESFDVINTTIASLKATTYDKDHLIVILGYEERGGEGIEKTAQQLEKRYASTFKAFLTVKHPRDLPNEIVGKGANITYAGKFAQQWLDENTIDYKNVVVTTLDADNHPHARYFDYVTYEYIIHEDRKHLSYQPVALFTTNIWDVPAPMRVVATGNSFWNIISSMRPHTLRNFAAHSQPMDALVEMEFWSTKTIVEDGHQYWRSYFYFNGNYEVVPLHIPIYQDAVLDSTYPKTLKAQFIQLRRWAYGASDVPYVATRIFSKKRNVPFLAGFTRFIRLLDGHVTLGSVSMIVAFGGWMPLLINSRAYQDVVAHQLPDVMSVIQQIALVGLVIMVFLSFKMLPPRPAYYKRHRTIFMLLQWVLMPVTAILYSSFSALNAQGRLFLGLYLTKFDVTAKETRQSRLAAKTAKAKK